jgi:hypothetical protein
MKERAQHARECNQPIQWHNESEILVRQVDEACHDYEHEVRDSYGLSSTPPHRVMLRSWTGQPLSLMRSGVAEASERLRLFQNQQLQYF